jgi:hypothetical protein
MSSILWTPAVFSGCSFGAMQTTTRIAANAEDANDALTRGIDRVVSPQADGIGTRRRDAACHCRQLLHSPQVSALKCGAITG